MSLEVYFEPKEIVTGTAEGKTIYIDDSSDNTIISAKFDGETSQETRSGKNYFDISKVISSTSVTNNGETLTVTTSSTSTAVLAGSPYKLSDYCPNLQVGDTVTLSATTTGTNKYIYLSTSASVWTFGTSKTITQNDLDSNVFWYASGRDTTVTISEIMISTQGGDYEEYGVMPSPDYPSEIKNLEGNLEVKVVNKNLFNESNVVNLAIGNTILANASYRGYYYPCKPGDIFSISRNSLSNNRFRVVFTNVVPANNVEYFGGTGNNATYDSSLKIENIVAPENANYIFIYLSNQADTLPTEIQLEKSSTATTYEEHQSQTVYFPLEEGQKLYEGSYLADDGIHNVRKQIVLNGGTNENWQAYTPASGFQYTYYIDSITDCAVGNHKSICSHFKNVTSTWSASIGKVGQYADHSTLVNKYFNTDKSTVETWETWLSNNPTTLEYELAEEEVIPYTVDQQAAWNSIKALHTYRGTTNITSDAYAEISYVKYVSNLIDEQYYTKLTNSFELFNDNFKLGSTPSNAYNLNVAKEGVIAQPAAVSLKDNGNSFAELEVDNIEEQDYEYAYTLTDKMVDLDFYYDASEIFTNGSTTLYNIVMDICTKVGLTLGTTNFRGYNKAINWYDNTRTAREYIGYIAELNGGFARIENNTLYFKKQKANSVKTISIDDCENFVIGEYHKITRVVYELGAVKYEFGNETGNTLYLNSDNVFITEESEVEGIYNDIVNFEFYSFSTNNCPIDYAVKAGDVITFTDGTNDYPTIAQYDLEYFGGWLGGYNLEINTEKQEETKIIGDKDRIRDLKIIVDRQNNTISQVVSEVDEQNTKISQTQQSVNELNSKIQDIADITTQAETIYGSLSFTDINQSEPIEVKIRPTTTNISYLYPRDNLYPSDTLYMTNRVLRFTNTDTSEVFDYELPDDLLVEPNSGTYDEFYLGYDQQICQVTKRCKYNADGTVSNLATEQVNTYTYPSIELTDGDYTVELLGYNNAYMNIRLMAANIYTSQFATKAELSSSISQTANEINLRVDEKLDEEDFNSANILLKINNDESSATISADKINLNGAVTANNNFKILTDGSMEAKNGSFTGGNIELIGGTDEAPQFIIYKDSNKSAYQRSYALYNFLVVRDDTFRYVNMSASNIDTGIQIMNTLNSTIKLTADTTGNSIALRGTGGNTYVRNSGIETPSVTQTSKEEDKKNFELLQNGLDIIKNTDIYKYNLKTQEDKSKKHIGFVIGKDYKYSHEITAENEGEEVGVDTYSMISVAYKAIQEQQEIIEQLQKEIKELKGE